MKCASRATLGVVIGTLNVLIYAVASIACICYLVALNNAKDNNVPEHNDKDANFLLVIFTIILVLCLIMTLISALLIMGVVKRRHCLMAPWLILSVIGFALSCVRTIAGLLTGQYILSSIFTGFLLAIHGCIIYKIYTLYKDIRNTNNVRPGQAITSGQVGSINAQSTYYSPVTD